jgi:beta-xylosidase
MPKMTEKKYAALHVKKRKKEDELAAIKDEISAAEAELIPGWVEEGMSKVSVGDHTVWLDRKLWASPTTNDELVAALRKTGNKEMVKETVNRQTLTGFVREHADKLDGPEQVLAKLPKPLQTAIKISEKINLRVRAK